MAHKHSIYDSDLHFIIDPITRKIKSESGKVILMQNDHNSERFTFQIPRYIEGHDMSLCNTTEIHYVNTDSENKRNQNEDIYPVTDLQVSPESEDIVIGSWLISQNATTYSGALNFIMRFACVNDKQELEYQWFTDVYSVIQIAKGIYNVDVMTNNDDPDLLAAWKNECLELTTNATTEICNKAIEKTTSIRNEAVDTLSGIRNEAVDTMNNICSEAKTEMVEVRDEAVTAITNIRNEAIDTSNETDEAISEFSKKLSDTVFMVNFETGDLEYESQNYTFSVNPVTGNLEWEYVGTPSGGVVGLADQLAKSKSDAIVLTAEGESIVVQDSSDDPLQGLRVFGKTTQNGTPTPDAPVPLVSVGDAGSVEVGVYGKNLFVGDYSYGYLSSIDGDITTTGPSIIYLKHFIPTQERVTIYIPNFHAENSTNYAYRVGIYKEDKTWIQNLTITSQRCVLRMPSKAKYMRFSSSNIYRMQVYYGDVTEYEEKSNYQSITLQTPTGLPGIPVTDESLATYTDADGQMWCADEVDFERGVYVQRIWKGAPTKTIVFTSREDDIGKCCTFGTTPFGVIFKRGNVPAMSTIAIYTTWANDGEGTFALSGKDIYYKDSTKTLDEVNAMFAELGTNFEVAGILAEPIETPLTSDILSTYSMLRTNYPVTTVLNDSGARMEFSYNADPKNYIDTKLAEIKALIS